MSGLCRLFTHVRLGPCRGYIHQGRLARLDNACVMTTLSVTNPDNNGRNVQMGIPVPCPPALHWGESLAQRSPGERSQSLNLRRRLCGTARRCCQFSPGGH
jgi:hypothetical protein